MVTNNKIIALCVALCGWVSLANAAPNIQHWVTDNGARVYFVPTPDLPMVDVRIAFDAGAARDGKQHSLALMTNGMLSEGAGDWNADQIAERFEGVGAGFSNNAKQDMAILSLRSLTEAKQLEVALATFTAVLTKPTFPEKPFERERKRLLMGLEQRKQSPDAVSDEAFYKAVFRDHPYAYQAHGNEASVNALTRQALMRFYQQYYVGRNAVVAIVGAVSRQEAQAIVNRLIGPLPAGQASPKLPAVAPLADSQQVRIDFPSSQSHILMGQPGLYRGDADYFTLYLGNHILGGSGLVSILSEEIREKRGLSYSSYSYFSPMRVLGPFIMGLQTRNDQVKEALAVMKTVLVDFVENGPTEAQLKAAKQNVTGGFALRIASNKSIVGYLSMIGFYGLPLNYLDTFIDNINQVSLAQIKETFKRRIQPNKMITVIVGGSEESAASSS